MKTGKVDCVIRVPAIADSSLKNIKWQSLHFYSYLLNKTIADKTNGFWINCWSKTLKEKYGKNYRKHINHLLRLGWIEENPKYKKGEFTKSFRISTENIQGSHKDYCVRLLKRVWETMSRQYSEDRSILDSSYEQLLKARHDTLHITKASTLSAKTLKTKLDCGIANIKTARNGRVTSTILLSPKVTRQYVEFGWRGRLVNVDVSSMIQQILNKDIKNAEWDKMIQQDFAMCLKKRLGLTGTRRVIKRQFMVAISKHEPSGQVRIIRDFLNEEFPTIMETVSGLNRYFGSVQLATQQREANLIRSFIMANQDLAMLPSNDGVFCGEYDVGTVQTRLRAFLKELGMNGSTKIHRYGKQENVKTTLEILESIPD